MAHPIILTDICISIALHQNPLEINSVVVIVVSFFFFSLRGGWGGLGTQILLNSKY
jgi:hypothetical protein